MSKSKQEAKIEKGRQYSPVYEKLVPIAIGVIVILVVGMLLLAGAIALDLIPLG
ncbi:MAG: hypothetical protein JW757_06070 [Anaerolineales bacterium]|nr:hypothetical protein [Anaerolineales bacterium]